MRILSGAFAYFVWTCAICICHSFSTASETSSSSRQTNRQPVSSLAARIDTERLVKTIRSGRVYQHKNFLSQEEIDFLLSDINNLRDNASFTRSGLSDTSRGQQQAFGSQDRSVSPVSWWLDALQNKCPSDNIVAPRLNELRLVLAEALERPTLRENDLAHECYYSISGRGSFLPRHMDDKHEDLKGPKGWLLPSRRSLSWLLYLSDPDWHLDTNGGALRSFPPKNLAVTSEPTHEGNLQIGWLHRATGSLPVYMDCWFRNGKAAEPHVILYSVSSTSTERQSVTNPWLNDNLPTNLLPMDFVKQMATRDGTTNESPLLFLYPQDARDFSLIEDREAWDQGQEPAGSRIEDVAPLRGSLVVFDSVLVPHQVESVTEGQRRSLAGWFHERTQEFPMHFYGNAEL